MVGEQKKSYDKSRFKADLLQLIRYVRGVFTDQPTRRFVHAFTLYASIIELRVFNRSGVYSSGLFDIHKKLYIFARALVGYATIDNDAIGLDTFIERGGYKRQGDEDTSLHYIKYCRREGSKNQAYEANYEAEGRGVSRDYMLQELK